MTPFGCLKLRVMPVQIAQHRFCIWVFDQRPRRHANLNIWPVFARFQAAVTVHPAIGSPMFVPNQIGQTADVLVRHDPNIATVPTIAAIRPAARHMSLPPKAHRPVPSVASQTFNRVPIHKHVAGL